MLLSHVENKRQGAIFWRRSNPAAAQSPRPAPQGVDSSAVASGAGTRRLHRYYRNLRNLHVGWKISHGVMAAGGAILGGYRGYLAVRTAGDTLKFWDKITEMTRYSLSGLALGGAVGFGILCGIAQLASSRKKAQEEQRLRRDETIEDNLATRMLKIESRQLDDEAKLPDLEERVARLEKQVELLNKQIGIRDEP